LLAEGHGQWQRGGIDGRPCGLDIAACLARPSARAADAETLELLLTIGEAAALAALNAKDETP
jgi:hypothetical protein